DADKIVVTYLYQATKTVGLDKAQITFFFFFQAEDGIRDECKPGLLVEQTCCDAADQPADSISGIKQTESQIALALRQDVRDNCLQQRVLCRIADTPNHHTEQDRREVAEKGEGREQ